MPRRTLFMAMGLTLLFGSTALAVPASGSYVTGNFALDLEGKPAGSFSGVAGGFAFGNVVEELESPDYFVKKHLENPPGYKDITIECGSGMSAEFYQWMKDVLDGKYYLRKSGEIVALDVNGAVRRRLRFTNAQITRITISAADAAALKTALTFKVTLTPASTSVSSSGGTYTGIANKKQLHTSNFRLTIPGLDTSKVSFVSEIDIAIPLAAPPDAACMRCTPVPLKINYPALEIAGSEATATTWFSWHQSFVIAGQNNDADEKSGTLDYLDSTMKNTLLSLSFSGLGISSISADRSAATDAIPRVRASMYVEKMTIALFPGP